MDNQPNKKNVGESDKKEERIPTETHELPSGRVLFSFGNPNAEKDVPMLEAFYEDMIDLNRSR